MRKKRKKRRQTQAPQRDNKKTQPYHPKKALLLRQKIKPSKKRKPYQIVEDLRHYNPMRLLYYKTIFGTLTGYKLSKPKKTLKQTDRTKDRIAFKNPLRTIVCIKRKIRREILFKRRSIGMGVSLKTMRIMSPTSNIKC